MKTILGKEDGNDPDLLPKHGYSSSCNGQSKHGPEDGNSGKDS